MLSLTVANGTWGIKDIYSDTEFTIDIDADLPSQDIAYSPGSLPSGVTFTDLQQPFRTPNSPPVDNKYGDVSELLFGNADMIAEYAVNKMLAANGGYSIPTGSTACYDDVRDFIQKCVSHNLKWGGNDRVYDQAKFYIDPELLINKRSLCRSIWIRKRCCNFSRKKFTIIQKSTYHKITILSSCNS